MKKWDIKDIENWSPGKHPKGGLIPDSGNSAQYNTGNWRTFRPEIDFSECTQCLFCFIFCPDSSINLEDGKVVGVDEKHCKGCGICATECPRDAISMVEEIKEAK